MVRICIAMQLSQGVCSPPQITPGGAAVKRERKRLFHSPMILNARKFASANLRVGNARAWRLEPGVDSPNVVGGYSGNSASGAEGATIGGGGSSVITSKLSSVSSR